jgi:hypothetical protein
MGIKHIEDLSNKKIKEWVNDILNNNDILT